MVKEETFEGRMEQESKPLLLQPVKLRISQYVGFE